MSAANGEEHRQATYVAHKTDNSRAPAKGMTLLVIVCVLIPLGIALGLRSHDEVQVFAGVLGLVCLALGVAYPFWGLIIFVGLLYTRPEEVVHSLAGMHFSLIASVVTTVSVVFQKLMDREPPVKVPVNGMILGFGAIVLITTFSSGDTSAALMDIGKLIALFLMVINLVNTPARYRILVVAIMIFTVYLSGFSIYQYFGGAALKREGTLQAQGTGIFGDPNDLSATICAGLGLALTSVVRTTKVERLIYILLTVFMIAGIYFTNSRGGMIAMIGVLVAFTFLFARAKWVAVALAVLIAGAAIKFGPSRMTELNTNEESANSRFRFWANGERAFIGHPILGVGYNRYETINNGRTAHNSFVLCFTELGITGYFCWTGCLYYGFRGLKRKSLENVADKKVVAAAENVPNTANTDDALKVTRPKTELRRPKTVKAPPRDPDFCDVVGARLALAGFLMAAFWITRTYVPVLFLLMGVPVAQQIAFSNGQKEFSLTPEQRFKDWTHILLICVASIIFIYLLANRLKD